MKHDTLEVKSQTRYYRALAACRPLVLFTIASLAPALANAQQLSALFSNGAGTINSVASTQVNQNQFVTAIINSGGYLEVIAWNANFQNSTLTRTGSMSAGKVDPSYGLTGAIAISSPYAINAFYGGAFSTAMINANGYLDISYWTVSTSGSVKQVAEVQGDAGRFGTPDVSITSVLNAKGYPSFMTAMPNSAGDLEVSLWYLNPANQIALSNTVYDGPIGGVSIAALYDLNSTVVTAAQNSAGELELIQWYSYNTGTVYKGNSVTESTSVAGVSVIPGIFDFGSSDFADAFYTGWVSSSNGAAYLSTWSDTLGVGTTGGPYEVTPWNVLAAHQKTLIMADIPPTGGGKYYLRVFDQLGNGIVTGAYGAGASSLSIAMVDISSSSYVSFAVAYRNSAGDLQIEVWKYTLA